MKFVMMRNRVIASVLGHSIGFVKGVPTHVPPALYEEVMAAGAVPEDELPEPLTPAPLSADDRALLIQTALEEIVLKNDTADFTAGGVPHAKVVSAKAGFDVKADERDTAWTKYLSTREA